MKNFIFVIFVFLGVESKYIYLKKYTKSYTKDLIKAFVLAIKASISIGYMILTLVKFLL